MAKRPVNEGAGRRGKTFSSVADACPRDGLQVRHHQGGRNSFSAHVDAKYPNPSFTEIKEVVQIAPYRSRRQRAARDGCAANRGHHPGEQKLLNASCNLKFALQP